MIKHIVCFKFKEFEQAEIVKNKLLALPALIPQIQHMEVGIDMLHSERSYHLALIVVVNNLFDLEIYAKHPDHLKVSEYIAPIKVSSIAVDFE